MVTVEQDDVGLLNAMSADDADVVDKRHLLITLVGEPDEMYNVGHHVPWRHVAMVTDRQAKPPRLEMENFMKFSEICEIFKKYQYFRGI